MSGNLAIFDVGNNIFPGEMNPSQSIVDQIDEDEPSSYGCYATIEAFLLSGQLELPICNGLIRGSL